MPSIEELEKMYREISEDKEAAAEALEWSEGCLECP